MTHSVALAASEVIFPNPLLPQKTIKNHLICIENVGEINHRREREARQPFFFLDWGEWSNPSDRQSTSGVREQQSACVWEREREMHSKAISMSQITQSYSPGDISHNLWKWMWIKKHHSLKIELHFLCCGNAIWCSSLLRSLCRQIFYRVCHGFRLTKEMLIFGSIFTTFEASIIFRGSWGSSGNQLEPTKFKPQPS